MSRPLKFIDFTRAVAPGCTVTAPAGYAQGANGLLSLIGADTARFEYDPVNGKCLGLLVEPAATNLLRQSRRPSDASAWSYIRSIASGADYDATGINSINASAMTASGPAAVVYQEVTGLTPGKRYTFSAYVRAMQYEIGSWSGSGPWVADVSSFGIPTRLFVDGVRLEQRMPGVDTGWPDAGLWRYDHDASPKTVTIGVNPAGKVVTIDCACLVGCIGFYLGAGTLGTSNPVRQRTAGRLLSPKSPGVPQLEITHPNHPFIVGDEVWFTGGTWTAASWAPSAEDGRRQNPNPGNCRSFFTVVADKRAEVRSGGGVPDAPDGYVIKLPESFRHPLHIAEADGGANVAWLGGQWSRLPHLQTGLWHRVFVTRTAPADGILNPAFFIQADYGASGPYDYSAEMPAAFASEGFLADFCQLQAGDYPTSPIVTTTAAASRAEDLVALPAPGGGEVYFDWGGATPELGPVSPLALADRRIARRVQLRRGAGDAIDMTVTSSFGDFARVSALVGDPIGEPLADDDGNILIDENDNVLVI